MKTDAVIGIDGGGSKTRFLLADLQGKIIASSILGPSTTGLCDNQQDILCQGISGLEPHLIQKYTIHSVVVSLGGFVDPKVVGAMKNITGSKAVILERESSGYIISQCASIWGFDIAVMAGTGSVAIGIGDNGYISSIGGWGNIIDDRGSGFALGKYGLRAVSDFIDRRGIWTMLVPLFMGSDLICKDSSERGKIKNMTQQMVEQDSTRMKVLLKDHLKRINRFNTASLAPLVIQAAEQEDIIAKEIINSAVKYLVELTVAVGKDLKTKSQNERLTAIGIGGLFNAGEIIRKPFQTVIAEMNPYINVEEKKFSIAKGTVYCALKNAGVEINNEILLNIKNCRL